MEKDKNRRDIRVTATVEEHDAIRKSAEAAKRSMSAHLLFVFGVHDKAQRSRDAVKATGDK